MKTLLIIRHSKTEAAYGNMQDKERALTDRGHADAAAMAQQLLAKGYTINKIFSSPAVRTVQSSKYYAQAHHVQEADIKIFDDLYLGDTLQILETVTWLEEDVQTLAVVAHNPGVTNFTNDMTEADIDGLPTSGVAIIQFEGAWDNFEAAPKKLVGIEIIEK